MPHREFAAARDEQRRAEGTGEPITFSLGDQTFTCVQVLPAWVVLDLQATDESDFEDAARATLSFFRAAIVEGDWRRFEKLVRSNADPVAEDTLYAIINYLAEAYAGRPTGRPSALSDGPSSTGPSSTPTSSQPALPVEQVEPVRLVPSSRAQTG